MPFTFAEVKEFLVANKGKRAEKLLFTITPNFPIINAIVFNTPYFDDEIKALSKEEAIEFYKQTGCKKYLILKGILTDKTAFDGSLAGLIPLNIWDIKLIANYTNADFNVMESKLYTSFLATQKMDTLYQKWFKNYLPTLPLAKAKEVVSAELRAMLKNVDPNNKAQTDWITVLRVLNTSYSEL